jgi:hypothetical protein
LVFFGWPEEQFHSSPSLFHGQGSQSGQHLVFHPSAQGATTQKKGLDAYAVLFHLVHHQANQPVVSKPVAHLDLEDFMVR